MFVVVLASASPHHPRDMAMLSLSLIDPLQTDMEWAREQLDAAERDRADAFVFPADSDRWTRVRAECKRLLAAHLGVAPDPLRWKLGPHDKPSISGHDLAFNLSHGQSLSALVISSMGPVGVDIEPISRGSELIEAYESFCHPDEMRMLPGGEERARALIELWTAKEAFLKAIGTGLSLPPEKVTVAGDRAHGPHPELAGLHLIRPTHPDLDQHALAIAAPHPVTEVEVIIHRP